MPDVDAVTSMLRAETAPANVALEAQRGPVDADLTWALLAIRAHQHRQRPRHRPRAVRSTLIRRRSLVAI